MTTVALLTPPGRGAVATISVQGEAALELAAACFTPAAGGCVADFPARRILFGSWKTRLAGSEEVVVCCLSETEVEVHCHGGLAASNRVMEALIQAGAQSANAATWIASQQADPLAAAAQQQLAKVGTERGAAILLDQLRGALRHSLHTLLGRLERRELREAAMLLDELLAAAPAGLHLTQPWRVVLRGQANAGKSSLLNAILGYRRALVFDRPGTTRDVLIAQTAVDGWLLEFADTAGLRREAESLEQAGQEAAERQGRQADLNLWVVDAGKPDWEHPADASVVLNKSDLPVALGIRGDFPRVSARTGEGVDELLQFVVRRLLPHPPAPGQPVPFLPRHVEALEAAKAALEAGAVEDAPTPLIDLLQTG